MQNNAHKFLSFAYREGALQFGEFVLNSGRVSPHFLNTGTFSSGANLSSLATFYSNVVSEKISGEFMLYGPAYKGIPLAAATAVSLHRDHNLSVSYAFNRKETKDHGEQGSIVGSPLHGRVVIVEDVITSGLSIDKAVKIICDQGAEPIAVIIALDRMERAVNSNVSAVDLVRQRHGLDVFAVATANDLLKFLNQSANLKKIVNPVRQYLNTYISN